MAHARAGDRELRRFGWIVGGVLAMIGLWPVVVRGETPRLWALVPGGILVLMAVLMPARLTHVHRGWMALGEILGWINTRLILGMLFYVLITPVALVMRLLHRDPLRRGFDPGLPSYRVARSARSSEHMRHQF
jgi:hypothetical protein